jgi:hypothetical protein
MLRYHSVTVFVVRCAKISVLWFKIWKLKVVQNTYPGSARPNASCDHEYLCKAGESICNRRSDELLSLNCPLTPDGSCLGVFGELIKLA